jgi:hypothetical protein
MSHFADDTIVEEIEIRAPADRVFTALASAEERVKWWGAEGRFRTTHVESDLRPQGVRRTLDVRIGAGFARAASRFSPSAACESPIEVDPAVELGRQQPGNPVQRTNERLRRRTRDLRRSTHDADDADALGGVTENGR